MKALYFTSLACVLTCVLACSNTAIIPETRTISSSTGVGVFSDDFKFDCTDAKSKKGNQCAEVYPVRGNDRGEITKQYIFNTPEEDLNARLKAIENARISIRIQALIFHGDELGRYITEILKRKLREGVSVQIIVDSFSNVEISSRKMYQELEQAGAKLMGHQPWLSQLINEADGNPLSANNRSHEKFWIVDAESYNFNDSVAIIGGLNVGNEYFRISNKAKEKWRDQDAMYKGNIVQDAAKAFDADWAFFQSLVKVKPSFIEKTITEQSCKVLGVNVWCKVDSTLTKMIHEIHGRYYDFDSQYENVDARLLHNRPRFKESYILQTYMSMFESAKSEVVVENAYFIPKKLIRKGLVDAAKRGVKVKILTNSRETNDLPQMADSSRYFYEELLAVNELPETKYNKGSLEIYEWNGHKGRLGTLHSKFAVIDGSYGFIGSYNLDPRSEKLNSESGVAFYNVKNAEKLLKMAMVDISTSDEVKLPKAKAFKKPVDPFKAISLGGSLLLKEGF